MDPHQIFRHVVSNLRRVPHLTSLHYRRATRKKCAPMLRRLLISALCLSSVVSLETITSTDELAAIEQSYKVHALLVLGTKGKDQDMSLQELATGAYPTIVDVEKDLEGLVTFSVVDIKGSIGNKWQLPKLPAFVVYKDPPKENPYTGKVYRDTMLIDGAALENPRKLKRILKQAIPTQFVEELAGGQETLKSLQKIVEQDEQTVALLISKQKHAPPLYHALAAEFSELGVTFVFLNKDEQGAKEVMEALKVEELPAMIALRSMTEHVVLKAEHTKSYHELKGFLEPFAMEKNAKKNNKDSSFIRFFSGKDFDDLVLRSDVVWIMEFMDSQREKELKEDEWKKTLTEVHRKAGVVALGAVSCEKETELCERHGGPGVRVFPLALTEEKELTRGEILPETFATINDAKEPAIVSIPDLTVEIVSTADLNGFISKTRAIHALPILMFTTKKHTPPMIKALPLSVPTQNIRLAIIHDADPDIKKQFKVKPSASTSLVCLVPTQQNVDDPKSAAFGIVAYVKKTMGSYTYPNVMQFLLQVLAQYPHPKDTKPESEEIDLSSLDEASAQSLVPYLTKKNMNDICGGNKICAIGFFEDHLDTLSDSESRLAKWWSIFAQVAAQSKQNREPFHFMWLNGKCQKEFAEAFGVGLFHMPTLAVYSPAKQRYATNVGIFDVENAAAFLKSVLSGSIGTTPIGNVPELGEECSYDEIHEITVGADGVVEDDEDLDDMLSEILSDEKQQRAELEKELTSELKTSKKGKKKHKSKKKKAKKKKVSRDEL